jgi:hypothetical protein
VFDPAAARGVCLARDPWYLGISPDENFFYLCGCFRPGFGRKCLYFYFLGRLFPNHTAFTVVNETNQTRYGTEPNIQRTRGAVFPFVNDGKSLDKIVSDAEHQAYRSRKNRDLIHAPLLALKSISNLIHYITLLYIVNISRRPILLEKFA